MTNERPMGQPLTEDDLTALNLAIEESDNVQETINRAKAAGIDVGEDEKRLADAVTQARAIKAAFFPGR